jgi:hypothetical protein
MWPAAAIDFTAKMQILYMINKGVENISDLHVNKSFSNCSLNSFSLPSL